jgi:uncharacterized YigZ family protein
MSSRSPADGSYRAPAAVASAELRERGSRFLAELVPIAGEAAARTQLRDIERRHPAATHHCWAWRSGWPPLERCSDAGEPAGTAGPPILRVLQGAAVSDALLVVTRWFGGVKLGRGGLARAYAGAASACLAAARLVDRRPTVTFRMVAPYSAMGAVRKLWAGPGVEVARRDFGERVVAELRVDASAVAEFESAVRNLGGVVELERIPRDTAP